jgi:hypothetical protein
MRIEIEWRLRLQYGVAGMFIALRRDASTRVILSGLYPWTYRGYAGSGGAPQCRTTRQAAAFNDGRHIAVQKKPRRKKAIVEKEDFAEKSA